MKLTGLLSRAVAERRPCACERRSDIRFFSLIRFAAMSFFGFGNMLSSLIFLPAASLAPVPRPTR